MSVFLYSIGGVSQQQAEGSMGADSRTRPLDIRLVDQVIRLLGYFRPENNPIT